ncbi:MAG: shikimate kinase [Halieaceae bacterium MED-G27]|jgi:hypothetical protein|nr:MAG: shikimate kinase [Halieaceae bacterium MED-G27]
MTPMKRFEHHHPLFVEGMGGYDTRDPKRVAQDVVESVQSHWRLHPPSKPPLLIVQGDPLEPRGISAITPLVATELGLERGLIVLDEDIASYHAPNADRDNVVMEARYSQLVERLEEDHPGTVLLIETAVDTLLAEKNKSREHLDKPPLADYYRSFALLQEVSKAALGQLCNELTLVHTSEEIGDFSVTSFYTVCLELGLLTPNNIVAFDVRLNAD